MAQGPYSNPLALRPSSKSNLPSSATSSSSSTTPTPDSSNLFPESIIDILKSWLSRSSSKIPQFWINATWNGWARVELFLELERSLSSDQYLILHDLDGTACEFEEATKIDILISPHDAESSPTVLLKLRCEKVSENEGSFERFVEEMQDDRNELEGMIWRSPGRIEEWGRVRVLLVGFSGSDPGEEEGLEAFRNDTTDNDNTGGRGRMIEHWVDGDVHAWVWGWDVTVDKWGRVLK